MLNDNVLKKLHRIEPLNNITKNKIYSLKSPLLVEDKSKKDF